MAGAVWDTLGDRMRNGLVIAPTATGANVPFQLIAGEHPQPGPGSLAAGQEALRMARAVSRGERLLVLLSGGASSLMAAPAPGIMLEEKRQATAVLRDRVPFTR
jgi:hydroxypyruvate reductase